MKKLNKNKIDKKRKKVKNKGRLINLLYSSLLHHKQHI